MVRVIRLGQPDGSRTGPVGARLRTMLVEILDVAQLLLAAVTRGDTDGDISTGGGRPGGASTAGAHPEVGDGKPPDQPQT